MIGVLPWPLFTPGFTTSHGVTTELSAAFQGWDAGDLWVETHGYALSPLRGFADSNGRNNGYTWFVADNPTGNGVE